MLTSSSEEATAIFEKFQNIDRHIQLKIEHPDNTGSLSLLDFKIELLPTGKIYTSVYRKPTAKNYFVHFKSAAQLSAKINSIRKEIKRIYNRCSEEKDKISHTPHFINTLRNNDYPTPITRHLNKKKPWKLHTPSNTCFLKLPHFSKFITKEICWAINKEGLDIQLAHSGPTLRQYLTKKHNVTITTCILANLCQKTYSIYHLICLKGYIFYIESTIRPRHIRIKEHMCILIP